MITSSLPYFPIYFFTFHCNYHCKSSHLLPLPIPWSLFIELKVYIQVLYVCSHLITIPVYSQRRKNSDFLALANLHTQNIKSQVKSQMTMFSLYDFTLHTKTSLRIINPTGQLFSSEQKRQNLFKAVLLFFVEECRCTTIATLAIFYYYFCTLIMIIIMVVTLPYVYLSFSKKILL